MNDDNRKHNHKRKETKNDPVTDGAHVHAHTDTCGDGGGGGCDGSCRPKTVSEEDWEWLMTKAPTRALVELRTTLDIQPRGKKQKASGVQSEHSKWDDETRQRVRNHPDFGRVAVPIIERFQEEKKDMGRRARNKAKESATEAEVHRLDRLQKLTEQGYDPVFRWIEEKNPRLSMSLEAGVWGMYGNWKATAPARHVSVQVVNFSDQEAGFPTLAVWVEKGGLTNTNRFCFRYYPMNQFCFHPWSFGGRENTTNDEYKNRNLWLEADNDFPYGSKLDLFGPFRIAFALEMLPILTQCIEPGLHAFHDSRGVVLDSTCIPSIICDYLDLMDLEDVAMTVEQHEYVTRMLPIRAKRIRWPPAILPMPYIESAEPEHVNATNADTDDVVMKT